MRPSRRAALVLGVVLGIAGCSDSPTEPGGLPSSGVIRLTVDALPVVSETGSLSLTSVVCSCTLSPLIVAVNGTVVGNMPCSAQQVFPMPRMEAGTARYQVLVTNGVGVSGLLSFEVSSSTPGAPSLAVQAACP
ncbi:hypothetical protein EG835_15545 [bacterium]|nr:hypothetical protein [bacterium]